MEIRVKVRTGTREESVTELPDGRYLVCVRVKPKQQRANARVKELLAEYFAYPSPQIRLIAGREVSSKVFLLKQKEV